MFGFNRKPQETKESAVSAIMVMNAGQPAWSGRNYKQFADEAYRKNVIANRCVSSIAEAIGSLKWLAYRGEQELSAHPALDILTRPNPMQTGRELIEAHTAFLLLSGNAYLEGVRVNNEVREIYTLRPDRTKVIPSASGTVAGYEYAVNGKKHRFVAEEIKHSRLFNPTDDFYGLSAVEAGAYAIDQHNEAMGWMQSLLQNSARPSGALVSNSERPLSDEQFHNLKNQIENQYSGSRNAGRPMLLEGGLDWKSMGLSPVDMEILEAKNSAARDICLAFGVPPLIIGLKGDNTYSNYAEARMAFWEDTVIPLATRLAEDLSQFLSEGDIELRPDLDQVPAIADKRKTLFEMVNASTFLTDNEKREALGYAPIAGGDELPIKTAQAVRPEAKSLIERLTYGG